MNSHKTKQIKCPVCRRVKEESQTRCASQEQRIKDLDQQVELWQNEFDTTRELLRQSQLQLRQANGERESYLKAWRDASHRIEQQNKEIKESKGTTESLITQLSEILKTISIPDNARHSIATLLDRFEANPWHSPEEFAALIDEHERRIANLKEQVRVGDVAFDFHLKRGNGLMEKCNQLEDRLQTSEAQVTKLEGQLETALAIIRRYDNGILRIDRPTVEHEVRQFLASLEKPQDLLADVKSQHEQKPKVENT